MSSRWIPTCWPSTRSRPSPTRRSRAFPARSPQVRDCAAALVALAKARAMPTLLVGHVTKEGTLAGPRTLEHVVDTVLSFDGDRHHGLRFLRAVKHRFGATSELGVFEMRGDGLADVPDASALFLADRRPDVAGSVVAPVLEGSRPLLVEVQALVASAETPVPRRAAVRARRRSPRVAPRGARGAGRGSRSAAPTCTPASPAACASPSRASTSRSRSRSPAPAPNARCPARRSSSARSGSAVRSVRSRKPSGASPRPRASASRARSGRRRCRRSPGSAASPPATLVRRVGRGVRRRARPGRRLSEQRDLPTTAVS